MKEPFLTLILDGRFYAHTRVRDPIDETHIPELLNFHNIANRFIPGKGLHARYWKFKLTGTGTAELLDMRADLAVSKRRV
jgi:hypothetical protein